MKATVPARSRSHFHRIFVSVSASALLIGLAGCGSTSARVSDSSVDFGQVAMGTQVRRIAVNVTASGDNDVTVAPKLSGSGDFSIAPDVGCGTKLASHGTCSVVVVFTPTSTDSATATLDLGLSVNDQQISLTGSGVQLTPGQSLVTATDSPLVALYTYAPQGSGDVHIEFGPDTNYGLETSAVTPSAGSPVTIYVAGMRANSTYHMRARTSGGETAMDQTFTTTKITSGTLPPITATSSGTPQSGIEFLNPGFSTASTNFIEAYAVDLEGNVVWAYDYPERTTNALLQSFHVLPDGNILALIGTSSAVAPKSGDPILLREFNLGGVPVRDVTLDQINAQLSGISLVDLHHAVTVLPNGHWLALANAYKSFDGLPGQGDGTKVLGDVIVDVDPSGKVVWTWSEFDTLDVKRAPDGYPDWTHSNAIVYEPDDGNLLVSIRHQNWVVKVDYRNGAGTGKILWRLGYQGDFKLVNGTEPQDWFFGSHQPQFVSSSTAAMFDLTLMDNGYNRQLTPGAACTGTGCYTAIPIYHVDEAAKTATILWRDAIDPSKFSVWGGGTTVLDNGNLEFDLCALGNDSEVDEVTVTGTPQTVWTLKVTGQNLYRANRMPSLYPGVQW
ncbi:hypothetical protein Acid345_1756 [Candidatus Koribacter versatilis Ellin345]|uniref:Arylsulfotransferase N-terminal domain-containing protein n=1 Tax=Koribacter versatilis (strain Ellin345) TaxID=204669 RepID=Q1IQU3_KORVE|nr:aryl-sulfate sulfotransferase [Candidatus Koribacter versatilis]ABF40757.1 hypothetical protein Acid345_1756 [Candidatus Koribacter versatilis Ellin345]